MRNEAHRHMSHSYGESEGSGGCPASQSPSRCIVSHQWQPTAPGVTDTLLMMYGVTECHPHCL